MADNARILFDKNQIELRMTSREDILMRFQAILEPTFTLNIA